jgi:hypothetical protein
MPLVFTGVLAVGYLIFLKETFSQKVNVSNLSFLGVLFIACILVVYGIFTAFWVKIQLIPILWILLFISPVLLFVSNKALVDVDMSIPDYRASGAKKT